MSGRSGLFDGRFVRGFSVEFGVRGQQAFPLSQLVSGASRLALGKQGLFKRGDCYKELHLCSNIHAASNYPIIM